VVGKHVIDYLASFSSQKASENEKALIRSYSEMVNSCLRQDADGVTVLSYLDPLFRRSYFDGKDSFRYVLRSACRNIQRQSKLCAAEDEQLKGRLVEVEGYFRREGCWIEGK
jgi:hypothetical protein